MDKPVLFSELSKSDKIDFFLKCQSLLVNHHPDSEFVIRESNLKERLNYAKELSERYKGLVYFNDNICVLFNKIKVSDPDDVIKALQENAYKAPNPEYNGVSIDFVVFRELRDCANWCRENYDPRIEYTVFVKGNKPKMYKTKDFVASVLGVPVAG